MSMCTNCTTHTMPARAWPEDFKPVIHLNEPQRAKFAYHDSKIELHDFQIIHLIEWDNETYNEIDDKTEDVVCVVKVIRR